MIFSSNDGKKCILLLVTYNIMMVDESYAQQSDKDTFEKQTQTHCEIILLVRDTNCTLICIHKNETIHSQTLIHC